MSSCATKFTNRELYDWMVGQISGIYFQSYQLAYDVAKRAECAYRYELGLNDSSFIQFGYWDSLKKGLLAGERLTYDLKRMEVAYLDQNKREYEIAKHVSLQLDRPGQPDQAETDRRVLYHPAGSAVRPRLPGALHAPDQVRRHDDSLRHWSVRGRQLHTHAAEQLVFAT